MPRSSSRWKFSIAILLPVVVAVLVTLTLAAGFVLWSAQRTDERALQRQQSFAAHIIEGAKSDLRGAQGGIAGWYEAVAALTSEDGIDHDWLDFYMGAGEYDDYGHDRVYVLDNALQPVFAAREGESVDPVTYDRDREAIDPLAVRFHSPGSAAGIAAYQAGAAEWPPQISDVVSLEGRAALVSLLPIVSDDDGYNAQPPGSEFYHVAVRFLDTGIAAEMMDDYLLEGAHFDTVPNALPTEAMVPVANAAGRFVAYFKWQPERPGLALLGETLPASAGLLGVVGLVIALLLVGLARSTAALDQARAEALFRATHDPLTGLANRALFAETLERAALPLSLLALDLDRFKTVNDSLGHEAGDELLRQVAIRLTALVRPSDIVARLGGDEFMILISGMADADSLSALAGRIVDALAQPFHLGREIAHIGVSVGIATAITDERKDLVSRADFALYDAKESGRNTYRVFDQLAKAA